MLRKTFIRLILIMAVATTSLIVFASTRSSSVEAEQCCDTGKEGEKPHGKSEWMILETISRSMMNLSSY